MSVVLTKQESEEMSTETKFDLKGTVLESMQVSMSNVANLVVQARNMRTGLQVIESLVSDKRDFTERIDELDEVIRTLEGLRNRVELDLQWEAVKQSIPAEFLKEDENTEGDDE